MSDVLVTGASGFIGTHVLARLGQGGDTVHAVSRSGAPPAGVEAKGCHWHACDLLQPAAAAELLRAVRPTHLLHLAWYAVPGRYLTAPENFAWARASLELLEAFQAVGGRRAVVAGSCVEYDWSHGLCSEEDTPRSYAQPYPACKNALRELLAAFAISTGMGWAWGRVFFLYGPHEPPGKLVASVINSLLAGEPAQCTEGSQRRDFLHVQDVADALVALLRSDFDGVVNIASGTAVSVKDLVTTIGRIMGRPELIHIGARAAPPEPPLVVADTARLNRIIGWRPQLGLEQGLADAVDWWRTQRQSA